MIMHSMEWESFVFDVFAPAVDYEPAWIRHGDADMNIITLKESDDPIPIPEKPVLTPICTTALRNGYDQIMADIQPLVDALWNKSLFAPYLAELMDNVDQFPEISQREHVNVATHKRFKLDDHLLKTTHVITYMFAMAKLNGLFLPLDTVGRRTYLDPTYYLTSDVVFRANFLSNNKNCKILFPGNIADNYWVVHPPIVAKINLISL